MFKEIYCKSIVITGLFKYSGIALLALSLLGCEEGFHSLVCDGHIATSSEPSDRDYRVIGQKSMRYEYTCWGTNGVTALVALPFGATGHCTVSVDSNPDKRGYFSSVNTVVSNGELPASTYNPRTKELKAILEDGYVGDGKARVFFGKCV